MELLVFAIPAVDCRLYLLTVQVLVISLEFLIGRFAFLRRRLRRFFLWRFLPLCRFASRFGSLCRRCCCGCGGSRATFSVKQPQIRK